MLIAPLISHLVWTSSLSIEMTQPRTLNLACLDNISYRKHFESNMFTLVRFYEFSQQLLVATQQTANCWSCCLYAESV